MYSVCIMHIHKYTHTLYYIGPSLVAQMVKNLSAMWERRPDPWARKIHWRRTQ